MLVHYESGSFWPPAQLTSQSYHRLDRGFPVRYLFQPSTENLVATTYNHIRNRDYNL